MFDGGVGEGDSSTLGLSPPCYHLDSRLQRLAMVLTHAEPSSYCMPTLATVYIIYLPGLLLFRVSVTHLRCVMNGSTSLQDAVGVCDDRRNTLSTLDLVG